LLPRTRLAIGQQRVFQVGGQYAVFLPAFLRDLLARGPMKSRVVTVGVGH
jgi:hypothetical protein